MSFDPLSVADFTVTDPPLNDPDFPAEHFMTHFMSQGAVVHTFMWIAQGPEPKGCVIISPQAFGGDRLESLIIPLLSSGISVMTFHPRGMWDGVHNYTLISALDDVHAAVEFLRTVDAAGRKTSTGNSYRIDPSRIAVLGLSGGGGSVAFAACAEIPQLQYGVAIAPTNHERLRGVKLDDLPPGRLDFVKRETAGRVDSEARLRSWTPADFDRISIIHNVPKLLSKTLLLIGGSLDPVSKIESVHRPITRAFRDANAESFTDFILETGHLFLNKRIALARLVIGWLRSECGF